MGTRWLSISLVVLFSATALHADVLDARKTFLRARTAVADGDYREALELYRKVIQDLPGDAVVRYEYAQLLRDLNVTDEAIKQAQETVKLDPSMPEGHRLLGALEFAAAGKDPVKLDRAIAELQQAQRLTPDDASTSVALARALLARGRAGDAARVLDQVPEAASQPSLMKLEAEAEAKSGRSGEAEQIYHELLQEDPTDRDVAAALIDLYEDEDRIDDALALLTQMEKKDPDNSAVNERITIDLARAGRFDDAEKRARALATKRPENRDVRRLLAQVLYEKGDITSAEEILRDLLASDAQDDSSRRTLVDLLVRDRRLTQAQAVIDDSRKKAPADAGAKTADTWPTVEQGYIAFLQKNYGQASQILTPLALTASGGSARATRILLGIARDGDDASAGLKRAQAAAAAEPGNSEWTAAVAEFRFRSGDKKSSEEALAKLEASDDIEDVLAAADVYARLKDYASAARVSRQALRRFPDNTEALFRLGSSLEREGQTEESEKTFRRLLTIRPNDAATLNYLGYMWADRDVHLDEAREMLEKAVAREPHNGAYRDSLGWVYFRMGRLDAAAKNLLDAHRTDPDDPTIEEHLGDLSAKQGDMAAAVGHWERALTLKPDEPEKLRAKLQKYKAAQK